jgi:hypothetical protein
MNFENHLSEEQLDDVLIGDPGVEATAHLTGCAACQARVAALEGPIASFTAVSLAWSERQSATTSARVVGVTSSAWPRRMSWALAATCLAVIGFAIPMARHEERGGPVVAVNGPRQAGASQPVSPSVTQISGAATKARVVVATSIGHTVDVQIARDNQMLQAIDRELDASVQSPSDVFGTMVVGGRPNGRGRNAPMLSWD